MTTDLEDRLGGLFDRVAGAVRVDDQALPLARDTGPTRRPRRRFVPAIAAAAVVVAGVGAIVALRDRDDSLVTVAQLPDDPPGALYVLPDALDDWTLTNGSMHTGEGTPGQGLAVGIATDSGFVDPVNVVSVPKDSIDVETWERLDVRGITLLVEPDRPFVRMVGERGEYVLTATGDEGTEWLIARAFGDIEVSADGRPTLVAGSPLDVIGAFRNSDGPLHETFFELIDRDALVTVETVTYDVLAGIGGPGMIETAEPATIAGVQGWHVTRRDVDGEWHGFGWMATPNRSVFVSGQAPIETVRAVAESLVIVDEETWVEATGCAC